MNQHRVRTARSGECRHQFGPRPLHDGVRERGREPNTVFSGGWRLAASARSSRWRRFLWYELVKRRCAAARLRRGAGTKNSGIDQRVDMVIESRSWNPERAREVADTLRSSAEGLEEAKP